MNANGDIFISDGYVNARVAKFDKNGDWVTGEPGSEPPAEHAAAMTLGNVYVANRGNVRVEVFDSDGKYLRNIKLDVPVPADAHAAIGATPGPNAPAGTMSAGAPWAICITPGPNQVLYAADAYPGRIYKVSLDGKVLGVLGKAGKQPKQFGWIHEIACPSENELPSPGPQLARAETAAYPERVSATSNVLLARSSRRRSRGGFSLSFCCASFSLVPRTVPILLRV